MTHGKPTPTAAGRACSLDSAMWLNAAWCRRSNCWMMLLLLLFVLVELRFLIAPRASMAGLPTMLCARSERDECENWRSGEPMMEGMATNMVGWVMRGGEVEGRLSRAAMWA